MKIEGVTEVKQAELEIQAEKILNDVDIELATELSNAELDHQTALDELEMRFQKEMAQIETNKFTSTMSTIGKDTIVSMAKAGPETQAKLLKGLGLKGFVIMDGKNPVNLFNTANGMLGNSAK